MYVFLFFFVVSESVAADYPQLMVSCVVDSLIM